MSLPRGSASRRTRPEPASSPAPGSTGGFHPLQSDAELATYYAHRAPEMEEAYHWPERAADIAHLRAELPRMVAGLDVLEVACGTGYWTELMAATARTITATDINREMLQLAVAKRYPAERVRLLVHDAWSLDRLPGRFNAAVALFWWSHVPHFRGRKFLAQLNRALLPGSLVILVDNLPSDCRCTPPVGFDRDGNSYQRRLLRSGEQFEIIKNYPSRDELLGSLEGMGIEPAYQPFDCLWLLQYRTPGA